MDVAMSGNVHVISNFNEDENSNDTGSAYVFLRDPLSGLLVEFQKLTPSNGVGGDFFGRSVTVSPNGKLIVVGSSRHDAVGTDSGAVYVFELSAVTGFYGELQQLAAQCR